MRCRTPFTFTNRKHHCRNCGNVFCGACSSNSIPLPHLGIMDPVRVDDGCHAKLTDRSRATPAPPRFDAPKPSKTLYQGSMEPRNPRVEDSFDADLKRALEMSLEDAKGNSSSGFVPQAQLQSQSKPNGTSKKPAPEEEEDADLMAAIAASLADMEEQKNKYSTDFRQQATNTSNGTAFVAPKSDFELTPVEAENINLFSTLVDRLQHQPPGAILREPQIQELYESIGKLRPKLARTYGETMSKHGMHHRSSNMRELTQQKHYLIFMPSFPLWFATMTACSKSVFPAHTARPAPCTACLPPRLMFTLKSPLAHQHRRTKAAKTTTRATQPPQTHMGGHNLAINHNLSSRTLHSISERRPSRMPRLTRTSSLNNHHSHTLTSPPTALARRLSNDRRVPPTSNLHHPSSNAKHRTNIHPSPPATPPKHLPPTFPTPRVQTTTTTIARRLPFSALTVTRRNHPSPPRRRCTIARRPSSSSNNKLPSHRLHSQRQRGRTRLIRGRTRRHRSSSSRLRRRPNSNSRGNNPPSNSSSSPRRSNISSLRSSSSSRVTGTPPRRTQWAGMGPRASLRRHRLRRRRRWRSR